MCGFEPKDFAIICTENDSDVRCVSWTLRNIIDPEALDTAIRLAGRFNSSTMESTLISLHSGGPRSGANHCGGLSACLPQFPATRRGLVVRIPNSTSLLFVSASRGIVIPAAFAAISSESMGGRSNTVRA